VLTLLQDIDEGFTHWRYRHILMVARMIGDRPGTGGSEGKRYLERNAAESRVFRDLLSLSTFQVPRSALPALPDPVREAMDSWLSSRWRARAG
jgi:tryptophan 2,3-dioxygenase